MEAPNNETIAHDVEKAHERIKKHIRRTALEYSAYLAEKTGANVYLKLENEQVSGAFKARGAFNKILKLAENQDFANKKIFTASSGNHGLGVALALKSVGKTATVYVPNNISKVKEENLKRHKAEVRRFGRDIDTREAGRKAAEDENGIYVSPCDDLDIVAGQGTIAFEILEDAKEMNAIFVTVGGGGLISGISSYAKHINPDIKIIGCSPLHSNAMEECVKAGKQVIIDCKDTLSEGSAGNVDVNTVTFPICQRNVDRWVNVTEQEISDAMYLMLDVHHKVTEGAGAVTVASFLKVKDEFQGQNVAMIICGGNVGTGVLKKVIDTHWTG